VLSKRVDTRLLGFVSLMQDGKEYIRFIGAFLMPHEIKYVATRMSLIFDSGESSYTYSLFSSLRIESDMRAFGWKGIKTSLCLWDERSF